MRTRTQAWAGVVLTILALPCRAVDFDVSGQAGIGYDDNVNNWADADEQRSSGFSFAGAALTTPVLPSPTTRLEPRLSVLGEHWNQAQGLSSARLGAGLRLVQRPSGDFYAPTLVSSLSATWMDFDSALRDGVETRVGFSLLQQLTTQLDARASVGASWRDAHGTVFDTHSQSLGLQLDWQALSQLELFAGYQRLFGDLVSSGPRNPDSAASARASAADDAFADDDFWAYRVKACTDVATAGANLALSPHWALEARAQHAEARSADGDHYRRWIATGTLLLRF
jgi:hypothetical protein